MKFLALIVAAQLATALPLAKEQCSGTDVMCKGQESITRITDEATKATGNAPLRSMKRSMEMPEKEEHIHVRPSEHSTDAHDSEYTSETGHNDQKESYNMITEADEGLDLTEGLLKRSLLDGLMQSEATPEFGDSYEGAKPETSSAAYHAHPTPSGHYEGGHSKSSPVYEAVSTSSVYDAHPTPSDVYGAVPVKPSHVYEAVHTPSAVYGDAHATPSKAYDAVPTPSEVYGDSHGKPSKAYEAVPTPSKVYGDAHATPSKAYDAVPTPSEVYGDAHGKPSKAYEAVPTPSKVYGDDHAKPSKAYEAVPAKPSKDTYESTSTDDSYDTLDLDLDILRKN